MGRRALCVVVALFSAAVLVVAAAPVASPLRPARQGSASVPFDGTITLAWPSPELVAFTSVERYYRARGVEPAQHPAWNTYPAGGTSDVLPPAPDDAQRDLAPPHRGWFDRAGVRITAERWAELVAQGDSYALVARDEIATGHVVETRWIGHAVEDVLYPGEYLSMEERRPLIFRLQVARDGAVTTERWLGLAPFNQWDPEHGEEWQIVDVHEAQVEWERNS